MFHSLLCTQYSVTLPRQDLCKWCCQKCHPFIVSLQSNLFDAALNSHLNFRSIAHTPKKIRIVKDRNSIVYSYAQCVRVLCRCLFSTRKCTPIASFIWSGFNVCRRKSWLYRNDQNYRGDDVISDYTFLSFTLIPNKLHPKSIQKWFPSNWLSKWKTARSIALLQQKGKKT